MEFRKVTLIVSLATSFLASCSIFSSSISLNKREKEEIVKVVYNEEDEEYIREASEQFFVSNKDGYMYYEDGNIIKSLYERKYTKLYPDYQSFKTEVLNNNVNPPFPKGMSRDGVVFDTSERFLVDSLVLSDLKQYSHDKFIEKYSISNNKVHLKYFI